MKTKPLRPIRETPEGVGISVEFMNDIIDRIEDLVSQAEQNRIIAGSGISVSKTVNGSLISVK